MPVADLAQGSGHRLRQRGLEPDLADRRRRDRDHACVAGELAVGRPDRDRILAPRDPTHRSFKADARAQPSREAIGETLVASGDARRVLVADVRDAGQGGRRDGVRRARGRGLEPGDQHLAGQRVQVEAFEQPRRGQPAQLGVAGERLVDHLDRGFERTGLGPVRPRTSRRPYRIPFPTARGRAGRPARGSPSCRGG